jgi:hypothetical protein
MNGKLFLPIIMLLVAAPPFQASHGTVIENVETLLGPACSPRIQYCRLRITILGEITAADSDEVKRLVDRTRGEAESKKWEYEGPFVNLDTPGGSVSAAMAIGRFLERNKRTLRLRKTAFATAHACCSLREP